MPTATPPKTSGSLAPAAPGDRGLALRALRGEVGALGLVAVLFVVNLWAVAGLVSARRDARDAIRSQAELEIRTDAGAFEALLAQQHADLSFLARSQPLSGAGAGAAAGDPVMRRWARLDVEASLLLFLQSSPAVRRLEVVAEGAEVAVADQHRGGAPQLEVAGEVGAPEAGWLFASWPLGDDGGELRAWVDPLPLLTTAGPGLRLERSGPVPDEAKDPPWVDGEPVEVLWRGVESELWSPPLVARVGRAAGASEVSGAVERLADRYRTTLLLNVALIPLSIVLGALTLRRVRRVARLESDRAQRQRLGALERQVQHAERLASLGRFAAGIAHEINNPLEGMANYLELLREDLEGGDASAARRWLPRLSEGIERAAGVVRQVQSFAEPGAGTAAPLDLAKIVADAVGFLRGHPDCRDAEIIAACPEPVPLVGDAQTLGQLVLNLVLNACQAQPGGGVVEVSAGPIEGGIELRVRDSGPGFPPELRASPFEPFRSGRGSLGLGLAVCHGIVAQHGGRIEVRDRNDGPGAEVRVTLPATASAANGPGPGGVP